MGYELISSHKQMIEPDRAKEILEKFPYSGQRRLHKQHISELKEYILRAEWKPAHIDLVMCKETKSTYLTNGQHSLHAISQLDFAVPIIMQEWCAQSFVDVAKIYAATDVQMVRTGVERLKGFLPERINLKKARNLASAVIYAHGGFSRPPSSYVAKSATFRSDIIIENWQYFEKIDEALGETTKIIRDSIYRVAALAVFVAVMKYQEEKASEFLRLVGQNDGLARKSPAWQYVNGIASVPLAGTNQNNAILARKVAAVWNAFYRGDAVYHAICPRRPNEDIIIFGTPYK